jgi:hypothetical protein
LFRNIAAPILARAALFAPVSGQGVVIDLGSQERNHSIRNSQPKSKEPVQERSVVINSTLLSAATARFFCADLLTKTFPQLSPSPYERENALAYIDVRY